MDVTAGRPWVVIPTCGESPHLIKLLHQLCCDVPVTVVINNIANDREQVQLMLKCAQAGADVELWEEPATIYQIWNWAIKQAQDKAVSTLSLLNDDVWVPDRSVNWVDGFLRMSPDLAVLGWDYDRPDAKDPASIRYVSGTYRKHGVPGFAFAVKPAKVPFIDERFHWWGGDDDLMLGAAAMGSKLGVLVGCGVRHYTSTTASARPWVYDHVNEDRSLLFSKWGDAW